MAVHVECKSQRAVTQALLENIRVKSIFRIGSPLESAKTQTSNGHGERAQRNRERDSFLRNTVPVSEMIGRRTLSRGYRSGHA